MKRDVTLECTYDSTPDEVWTALTDPTALSEWLMGFDLSDRKRNGFLPEVEVTETDKELKVTAELPV